MLSSSSDRDRCPDDRTTATHVQSTSLRQQDGLVGAPEDRRLAAQRGRRLRLGVGLLGLARQVPPDERQADEPLCDQWDSCGGRRTAPTVLPAKEGSMLCAL